MTSRHATGVIARLAKAVQSGCANGQPGTEAAELAEMLLAPVAPVVDACRRLIIVPYGPLHGLPFHVLPLGEMTILRALTQVCVSHSMTHVGELELLRTLVGADPVYNA